MKHPHAHALHSYRSSVPHSPLTTSLGNTLSQSEVSCVQIESQTAESQTAKSKAPPQRRRPKQSSNPEMEETLRVIIRELTIERDGLLAEVEQLKNVIGKWSR